MDFGKIAAKLRASAATTSTLALTEETEVSGGSSCPRATDGERAASAAADGVGLDQLAAANGENGCRLVGEVGLYASWLLDVFYEGRNMYMCGKLVLVTDIK